MKESSSKPKKRARQSAAEPKERILLGKIADPLLAVAALTAQAIKAKALLICSPSFTHLEHLRELSQHVQVLLTSHSDQTPDEVSRLVQGIVQVPKIHLSRTAQIKLSVLMAMAQGMLSGEDVLVCLSGLPGSERLDTLVTLSVKDELGLFAPGQELLSPHVQPEVFEKVLDIAIQLAIEGREGHPVGTMFVVGDYESVAKYCTQLVLNPFKGYPEENRSILDPALTETIKEFSSIDGAFVIRGDGVIESAGTFLQPGALKEPLPLGLGTRHAAAAGITSVTEAIAITVSASTGAVRIFRSGKMVIEIERPRG